MNVVLVSLAAAFAAAVPRGVEIKLIASNAVREPYEELLPTFEKATGHRVAVDWGGTLDVVKRVRDGDVADAVIVPDARIDELIKEGRLVSRVNLVRSGVGIAVPTGARHPDVSSVEALKVSLLAATSIVLSSGPSSFYLLALFPKLGIDEAIKPKIIRLAPGAGVGGALARREGEIGFTQISELLSVEGIDYLGPLPAAIQSITVFSAGLHAAARAPDAARTLIKFLTAPEAAPVLKRHGMDLC
ncbi:MAG TPA: substrate-binding domain-containing protein [Xanthobacteraceae bacterium]|nr:substrate-binding domain-containing protein [Xanthobacteraceae bacterium]